VPRAAYSFPCGAVQSAKQRRFSPAAATLPVTSRERPLSPHPFMPSSVWCCAGIAGHGRGTATLPSRVIAARQPLPTAGDGEGLIGAATGTGRRPPFSHLRRAAPSLRQGRCRARKARPRHGW